MAQSNRIFNLVILIVYIINFENINKEIRFYINRNITKYGNE